MHESEHSVLANRLAARKNWSPTNSERHLVRARTRELPMAVLCLVALCTFPSPNRAQVPVYEVTPVESSIKFGVESSVPIKGIFDKWSASLKFSSTDVRSGILDIEIQADSVNTGSGMKNNKLKSKDFFNAEDSPIITFKSTKVRLAQTHSIWKATLPFVASRRPKNSLFQTTARDQPPGASMAQWPSIAKTTG